MNENLFKNVNDSKELKPKRTRKNSKTKNVSNSSNTSEESIIIRDIIQLPEYKFKFDFFLKKPEKGITEQYLCKEIFGENYNYYTEPEKIYVIINALSGMQTMAPIEAPCEHCDFSNKLSVNLKETMETEGSCIRLFEVNFKGNKFLFERPLEIFKPREADIVNATLYMVKWLKAYNKEEKFDITSMEISDVIELNNLFFKEMFGLSFKYESTCTACKKTIEGNYFIELKNLIDLLNVM